MTISFKNISELGIKKSRCKSYLHELDSPNRCQCGLSKNEHNQETLEKSIDLTQNNFKNWSAEQCSTDDELTDAYGEIKFTLYNENVASYLRISPKTSPEKILKIFFSKNILNLKLPKLVISVKGATECHLKAQFKKIICKGLVKTASSTCGWLIGSGLKSGLGKNISEEANYFKENISVLGITSWSAIQKRNALIRKGAEDILAIDYDDSKRTHMDRDKTNLKFLDPYCNLFLFVDDANLNSLTGCEKAFRSKFENVMSNNKDVPLIVINIEGNASMVWSTLKSVQHNIPCIFVNNTGRFSNIMSSVYQILENSKRPNDINQNYELDQTIIEKLTKMIQIELPNKNPDQLIKNIQEIFQYKYRHLLNVFDLNETKQAEDLDECISVALLKAKGSLVMTKLCLEWNRFDVARDLIFEEEKLDKINVDELNNFMYTAILENRAEFIELFLENDFNLKQFLTYRRLLNLFIEIIPNSIYLNGLLNKLSTRILSTLTGSKTNDIQLSKDYESYIKVSVFIRKLIPFITGLKCTESSFILFDPRNLDKYFNHPENELFFLNLLASRYETAKIFWSEGKNQIASALLASKLINQYSRIFEDTELIKSSNDFENLAVELLQNSYSLDETQTQHLLIRKIRVYGNKTCLQLAIMSNCLSFLSHGACQNLFLRIWYHKILPDTPSYRLYLSMVFPLFAPFLVYFRDKKKVKLGEDNKEDESQEEDAEEEEENEYDDEEQIESGFIEPIDPIKSKKQIYSYQLDFYDSFMDLNYFERCRHFWKTPFVKFVYNQIFYLAFLVLFSYVILCDFFPVTADGLSSTRIESIKISVPELVLIIWTFTFATDELRKFDLYENDNKSASFANFVEYLIYETDSIKLILFFVAIILRFIPNYNCYIAARSFLAIDIIMWFYRSLNAYLFIKTLGPKLIMINKMLKQLAFFLLIVLSFIFAFGISITSLMFFNSNLDSDLLKTVFFPAYFIIGGEYFTREDIMNADTCNATENTCPNVIGAEVSLAEYIVYLIFINILLINILIAIFNQTYTIIEQESGKISKYQRYLLVFEYFHKPPFPPPIIFIFDLIYLFKKLVRVILTGTKLNDDNTFKKILNKLSKKYVSGFYYEFKNKSEEDRAIRWEQYISDEYDIENNKMNREKPDFKLQKNFERLDVVYRKQHIAVKSQNDLRIKVEHVETKLKFIMDLLTNLDQIEIEAVQTEDDTESNKEIPDLIDLDILKMNPTPKINNEMKKEIIVPLIPEIPIINESVMERVQKHDFKQDFFSSLNKKYVPWSETDDENYKPNVYTAVSILKNPNADPDLLAYPDKAKPKFKFNQYDKRYKVDRTSIFNYLIKDSLPLFPYGRTGTKGRNQFFFWGPNQAVQIMMTRSNSRSNFEVLVVKTQLKFVLPYIILENNLNSDIDKKIIKRLFDNITDESKFLKLKKILSVSKIIDKYIPDSEINTDNAWIEFTLKFYHIESNLYDEFPIKQKNSDEGEKLEWQELNQTLISNMQDQLQIYFNLILNIINS